MITKEQASDLTSRITEYVESELKLLGAQLTNDEARRKLDHFLRELQQERRAA